MEIMRQSKGIVMIKTHSQVLEFKQNITFKTHIHPITINPGDEQKTQSYIKMYNLVLEFKRNCKMSSLSISK